MARTLVLRGLMDDTGPGVEIRVSASVDFRDLVVRPIRFPRWVPPEVRAAVQRIAGDGISKHQLPSRAEILVWRATVDGRAVYQFCCFFPESETVYQKLGVERPRDALGVVMRRNRMMRYLVEGKRWSPDDARHKVARADPEAERLVRNLEALLPSLDRSFAR